MKVNLKKAAALSKALLAAVPPVVFVRKVSPYSDAPDPAEEAADLNETLSNSIRYTEAAFKLRQLLSRANAERVNDLLVERACLDSLLMKFKDVPLQDMTPQLAVNRALEAARAPNAGPAYGRDTGVSFNRDTTIIVEQVSNWKQRKTAVEDTLAGVNFTTEIEIPEDVVETLRSLKLV